MNINEKKENNKDIVLNGNGTIRYNYMNTRILRIVVPDTYNNYALDNIYEDKYQDALKEMTRIGEETLREVLTPYNIGNVTLKSPQFYNYETDWFEFTIVLTPDERNELIGLSREDGFFEWAKKEFGSYPGFVSTMPIEEDKFYAALDGTHLDDYKENKAIQMLIRYKLEKKYGEKRLLEIDDDFWESVQEFFDQNDYYDHDDYDEDEDDEDAN